MCQKIFLKDENFIHYLENILNIVESNIFTFIKLFLLKINEIKN